MHDDTERTWTAEPGIVEADPTSRVLVLAISDHPEPGRAGEAISLDRGEVPIDRVSAVFPGGPLADPSLSRLHAQVRQDPDDGVRIVDLGSKNGTFVDERRVPPEGTRLRPGSIIRVGEVVLVVLRVEAVPPQDAVFPEIVGWSQAASRLRGTIGRFGPRAAPVLVVGETGTGKELVARSLAAIGRPGKPFVTVNAAALPATLVEAELFGHGRGAFTGAVEAGTGLFRAADRGTLFLDEVGDLPVESQAKLLRVIEEGRVLPLGSSRPVPIDVRVIAATNRDPLAEVRAGRFRQDLYGRLSQLVIRCPPLRGRFEDIPVLVRRFAQGRAFSAAATARLMLHPWPFNIRELRGIVEQASASSPGRGPLILGPDLVGRLEENLRHHVATAGAAEGLTREAVEATLARTGGNVGRAAAALGKDRANLYRTLRRLGIDVGKFRK